MISEFPLFCFTTLAGLSAGAYVVGTVFPVGKGTKRACLFPLVCLVLLGVGLLGLPMHLGRPERLLISLTHPTAMIAQEAYWSMAFGVVLLIDFAISKVKGNVPRALRVVGAVFALVLMCVMGNAYFVSLAVPAWASWTTFPLFVLGDLAMGAAGAAVFDHVIKEHGTKSAAVDGDAESADVSALRLIKQNAFLNTKMVLAALAAVTFVAEAVHFDGIGLSAIPFALAAIIAVAGVIATLAGREGKLSENAAVWLTFVCLFVAVVVARYSFYAAYAL